MQHFCRRTQPRKFEYFENNIGDRFLDRKNKNYENFLTGETTKKYRHPCKTSTARIPKTCKETKGTPHHYMAEENIKRSE